MYQSLSEMLSYVLFYVMPIRTNKTINVHSSYRD